MLKEELIKKEVDDQKIEQEAQELYNYYLNQPRKWRHRHNQYNHISKCINIVKKRYGIEVKVEVFKKEEPIVQPQKKRGSFAFYRNKMEDRYWTYHNYLKTRCEALPQQLEKKFKNCLAYHTASRCWGMSNYIRIAKEGAGDEYDSSITIRISDHDPTGSGGRCDHYLYVQDRTWAEIKEEVFKIAESFLK